ncbi:MAG: hypothetical protein ACK5M1_14595 [Xanthomarina gelatinilytica]|uniref:hypothetical protein n=1 Tax=Xanthomarina gelatinilytica TaxID=1137281 RepID=UPI003A88CC54
MKQFFLYSTLLYLCIFTSCSNSDDNNPSPENSEYITWTSLDENYETTQIFRRIDGVVFELTGEETPFFNLSIDVENITQGLVVEASESNMDSFYLGYDNGTLDVVFSELRVEFLEVTDTYILGEFQGDNANLVNNNVVPNTSVPSDAVIVNGEFRINL